MNHRGVFGWQKKWSALITDMFVMIAFSIWDLRYNDDTTLSCQHDLMVQCHDLKIQIRTVAISCPRQLCLWKP
jgi:hypothetical protein